SVFNLPGSTASKFQAVLTKAMQHVANSPDLPKLVTVYNVSEWAEGGAGLTANREDGWGYLDALRGAAAGVSATPVNRRDIIPLTLANGWVNYDAFNAPARVWKDESNLVHLSGMIKSGTIAAGTRIATLPYEYR